MSHNAKQSFGLKVFLKTGEGTNPVRASLDAGTSNAMVRLTAVKAGTGGNSISFTIIAPSEVTPLSVAVTDRDIVVTAEYAGSAIASTANDIIEALLSNAAASALVIPSSGTGDGSSLVAAFAEDDLAGGTNGSAVYSEIPGILDVSVPGFGRTADDITSHSSEEGFAEYLKSRVKEGRSLTLPLYYDPSNTVHQLLKAAEASDDADRFRFVYPHVGGDFENEGLVLNFSSENPVRGVFTGSVEVQLTGALLPIELA